MIDLEETITEPISRSRFTMATPDTSNITADVEGQVVTLTYGGSVLVVPVSALPALTALTATVSAGVRAFTEVPEPAPEPTLPEEP